MKKPWLIFVYTRDNRSSLRPLIAATDLSGFSSNTLILSSIERDPAKLIDVVNELEQRGVERILILTSMMTTQLADPDSSTWKVIRTIRKIKTKVEGSKVITIAGGPHPSGDPFGTLINLGFDFVVIGEGEKALPFLVEKVAEDGLGEKEEIVKLASKEGLGIATRSETGDLIFSKRSFATLKSLDESIPFPIWRNMLGHIEIARGCPWACKFCQVSFMHGCLTRYRSIENVKHWILRVIRYRWRKGLHADIRFVTPDAFSYSDPNGGSFEDLMHELRKIKEESPITTRIFVGSFPSEVRPDSVNCDVMRALVGVASNERITIGAQSGSDRVLDFINRGHCVDDIVNAVEIVLKSGFSVDIDFIFGLPGEKREDREDTMRLIQKLIRAYGSKVRVHAHTFLPLPGTPFSEYPAGRLEPDLKREFFKIAGSESLYGKWAKQEVLGRRIEELRRSGMIMTFSYVRRLKRESKLDIKFY